MRESRFVTANTYPVRQDTFDGDAALYARAILKLHPGVMRFNTGAGRIYHGLMANLPSPVGMEQNKEDFCRGVEDLVYPLAANLYAQAVAVVVMVSSRALSPPVKSDALSTFLAYDIEHGIVRRGFLTPHETPDHLGLSIPSGITVQCRPLHYHYHRLKERVGLFRPRHASLALPNRAWNNRNRDSRVVEDVWPPPSPYVRPKNNIFGPRKNATEEFDTIAAAGFMMIPQAKGFATDEPHSVDGVQRITSQASQRLEEAAPVHWKLPQNESRQPSQTSEQVFEAVPTEVERRAVPFVLRTLESEQSPRAQLPALPSETPARISLTPRMLAEQVYAPVQTAGFVAAPSTQVAPSSPSVTAPYVSAADIIAATHIKAFLLQVRPETRADELTPPRYARSLPYAQSKPGGREEVPASVEAYRSHFALREPVVPRVERDPLNVRQFRPSVQGRPEVLRLPAVERALEAQLSRHQPPQEAKQDFIAPQNTKERSAEAEVMPEWEQQPTVRPESIRQTTEARADLGAETRDEARPAFAKTQSTGRPAVEASPRSAEGHYAAEMQPLRSRQGEPFPDVAERPYAAEAAPGPQEAWFGPRPELAERPQPRLAAQHTLPQPVSLMQGPVSLASYSPLASQRSRRLDVTAMQTTLHAPAYVQLLRLRDVPRGQGLGPLSVTARFEPAPKPTPKGKRYPAYNQTYTLQSAKLQTAALVKANAKVYAAKAALRMRSALYAGLTMNLPV